MRTPKRLDGQRVAVSFELSEHGVGQCYIHADNCEQAADAHRLLAVVTPELDALSKACKKAFAAVAA